MSYQEFEDWKDFLITHNKCNKLKGHNNQVKPMITSGTEQADFANTVKEMSPHFASSLHTFWRNFPMCGLSGPAYVSLAS